MRIRDGLIVVAFVGTLSLFASPSCVLTVGSKDCPGQPPSVGASCTDPSESCLYSLGHGCTAVELSCDDGKWASSLVSACGANGNQAAAAAGNFGGGGPSATVTAATANATNAATTTSVSVTITTATSATSSTTGGLVTSSGTISQGVTTGAGIPTSATGSTGSFE